ncbi:MAG: dihydrolipoyl dehydrogenase [Burkholderiales bacterium]|nr:dihydrolipoyl dehydrogenase [Burkholderiales bacterium]
METLKVDVAIIGAGTAGLNARREVEKRGGRPLLIESGPYGTTCARVGCMPSKLLIAAADVAHTIDTAPEFGLRAAGGLQVDGAAVMARVRRERDRFAGFMVEATEAISGAQRLRGHARFTGPTTLEVDGRVGVAARTIVVAAGSQPFVPPPFDRMRDRVMVSDDVFELRELPESIAVIGTGVIALELGQALQRLGVRVAFFNPFEEVGAFTDPEVKRIAERDLAAELDLRLGIEMLEPEPGDGSVLLRWRDASGTAQEERFAQVLVAAGRRPRIAGLGLETTGLALDASGLPKVDPRTAQCGDAPIFFAGDVDGKQPLLHEAADEGRIAGENAMRWPDVVAHDRRTPLAIAFTEPQMALVGARFADLPPGRHAIGTASFDDQGRARVAGRNSGLVRLYAETGSCKLIGAEMFGPGMEHMAHLIAWAVQQRMTVQRALAMPFYHPVLEEGLRTGLRDLAQQLRVLGECRAEDMAESAGQ